MLLTFVWILGKTITYGAWLPVYFCKHTKKSRLKNLARLVILILVCAGCKSATTDKKIAEDSLLYIPPIPKEIDKAAFQDLYNRISIFYDTALLQKGFNGGLIIAQKGNIIFEKYQGKIDFRKDSLNNLISDSTPLHIASTSKTFTGVAIMRLAQEGKLSLNDSVTKFFPAFPYKDVTVQSLLNHRSGLPNYLYFISNSNWDKNKLLTNEDMLQFMVANKPDVSYPANTHFSYCNTNYVLLAMIIEKVTGKTFPAYMQSKYFGPLQMKHSYVFTVKDTAIANMSFNKKGSLWDYDCMDGTYGDKNIYTTPRDLLKWDQALYTDQLLNKLMLDSSFKGYSNERPSIHNYGLGWRLQFLPNGKRIVYHFGKWHGFNAAFARLIDEEATIIILGNKFNKTIYGSAQLGYDIFGAYFQTKIMNDEPGSDSLQIQMPGREPEVQEKKKEAKLKKRK
jgi:CubicO group peptidase (beta-lactamase class C family)